MGSGDSVDITRLLDEASGGGQQAFGELIGVVYDELRRIADRQVHRQFNRAVLDGLTRQPTEIVHEAVMRLAEQHTSFKNRGHFFGIATQLIVRTITDYQRHRMAGKRGGGDRGQALAGVEADEQTDVVAWRLDFAADIQRLEAEHPRAAEGFVLRVVADHAIPEIAKMLAISRATAERDWRFGRAYFLAHRGSNGREASRDG